MPTQYQIYKLLTYISRGDEIKCREILAAELFNKRSALFFKLVFHNNLFTIIQPASSAPRHAAVLLRCPLPLNHVLSGQP